MAILVEKNQYIILTNSTSQKLKRKDQGVQWIKCWDKNNKNGDRGRKKNQCIIEKKNNLKHLQRKKAEEYNDGNI